MQLVGDGIEIDTEFRDLLDLIAGLINTLIQGCVHFPMVEICLQCRGRDSIDGVGSDKPV